MAKPIEVSNQQVIAALTQLYGKIAHAAPILGAIGEDVVERTKQRFATTTGPDGQRWRPNTHVTIMRYIMGRGGFAGKSGKINAKGQKLAISKRPLQGITGDLARQIFHSETDDALLVGSSMIYAAMQHFGGSRAVYRNLWGNIPARQFMPINAAGELYPDEGDRIVTQLQQYLMG